MMEADFVNLLLRDGAILVLELVRAFVALFTYVLSSQVANCEEWNTDLTRQGRINR